ncbi:MBL fold metallo-hydrolase [Sphingosinicella sp. LHD-64]|uniref:MBL fold metallo-hydrolase n=1 Tax=Sphingosinicella sp. LHD-64 TaxID=3072139 RepID=UPI00280F130D|nr:MBL fold metallo-hydrolase [Sphingosinicella sp. LHD-64]MDQ8757091.1 MBL fold metallo-hydrolase [Sphingosinicella sp. LHD-64]
MPRSLVLFVSALLLSLAANCSHHGQTPASRIYYTGAASDHFNGETFFNPDGEQGSGGAQRASRAHFMAIATGKAGHHNWSRAVPVRASVPPRRIEGDRMLVTWIGHATALVQTQGLNILLDPVWAHRDSPVQFAGPRRVRAPGVRIEDLPPIDLVLISHNHYDHLDIGALRHLAARDRPMIVAGLGNDALLARHGLQVTARDWGERVTLRPGVDIILERAHHWSAHWTDDHDRALWAGFTVTLPGGNLYFAGDTGPGDMRWPAEAARSGPVRLAVLPIGPYQVNNPSTGSHIGPDEAVAAFRQLGAAYALGVHWGTFELTDEPIDGPPTRLREELRRLGLDPGRFRTVEAGESWEIPRM